MSFDNSTQLFIPAVWALLPDEQTDTLVVLFIYIKKLLNSILKKKINWSPEVITLDFSSSNINACRISFDDSIIHGCQFHFMQAIYRKLMKTGLNQKDKIEIIKRIKGYKNKSENFITKDIERWIKELNKKKYYSKKQNKRVENKKKTRRTRQKEIDIIEIKNLETGGIKNCILLDRTLENSNLLLKKQTTSIEFEMSKKESTIIKIKFLKEYFLKTWIKRFPPKLWSLNLKIKLIKNSHMISSSNNPIESWHRTLNHVLKRKKPSLLSLIKTLKEIEYLKKKMRSDIIFEETNPPTRVFNLQEKI
ncbi:hypothetical protein M0813_18752 [Anaeramoeba flamelloides]|uniref:MULE transposase domain-containing protein n=1 Tax=Anaeramoeba flamelloides TaxID=1746091 RepID=A0ABQ8YRU8_9EUKA|nr:hypothetical protein M0813_18752 [Anaeramoeba flamelloides]